MTVTLDNGQLKVTLSEPETVKYNIDRVFFDRHGKEAQLALLYLLKTAAAKTTFKPETGRFLIELYPVFDGGCEVFFIPDKEPQPTTLTDSYATFEMDSSEALLSAIEFLYLDPEGQKLKASLFQSHKGYQLVVNNMPKRLYETVLLNFADRIPSKRKSKSTVDTAISICKNDAIGKIGHALTHRNQIKLTDS